MTLEEVKDMKKLFEVCTKLVNLFTDCYIMEQGYVVSLDLEKPYLIHLEDRQISYFKLLHKEFKVLHVKNLKTYKAAIQAIWFPKKPKEGEPPIVEAKQVEMQLHYEDYLVDYEIVSLRSETTKVVEKISMYLDLYGSCDSWKPFQLSTKEEENVALLQKIFKENDSIQFKPEDALPNLIFTKSLVPMVSEKNYMDMCYSTKVFEESLYLIIFDFAFPLFQVLMFHYYIDIDESL